MNWLKGMLTDGTDELLSTKRVITVLAFMLWTFFMQSSSRSSPSPEEACVLRYQGRSYYVTDKEFQAVPSHTQPNSPQDKAKVESAVQVVERWILARLRNVILADVAALERSQRGELFCVGFAAESHDLIAHAKAKRERKKIPLMVGNIGADTFGSDDNALWLIDAHGEVEWPRAPKLTLARRLVADIARRLTST